jgi:hypothetical protein
MRYTVFETTPYGAFVKAGDLDAASDREALKHARLMLASGAGELRQDMRTASAVPSPFSCSIEARDALLRTLIPVMLVAAMVESCPSGSARESS